MAATITEISIRGYKSIAALDRLPLRSLNVLIGANGAGKSNFISYLRLLRAFANSTVAIKIEIEGGADAVLHMGLRATPEVVITTELCAGRCQFAFVPTADNRLLTFARRSVPEIEDAYALAVLKGTIEPNESDSQRDSRPRDSSLNDLLKPLLGIVSYHFDDTRDVAALRRWGAINDDEHLRPDASNLAAFLHRIRVTHPDHLTKIRDVVRLAAPFFDDFKLRPIPTNPDQIQLEWTQAGTDYPFRPSQLSDGTLRFICLATALLQPDPPAVMMFDEPELGLHPYALTLLAALFQQAALGPTQIIVSTQSATLLNEFDAEDIIVVERANGSSTFRRLDPAALTEWLDEYSIGDLWQKNVFGGRPKPEAGRLP